MRWLVCCVVCLSNVWAAPLAVFDDDATPLDGRLEGSRVTIGGGSAQGYRPLPSADVRQYAKVASADSLPTIAGDGFEGSASHVRIEILPGDIGWWSADLPLPEAARDGLPNLRRPGLTLAIRGAQGREAVEVGLTGGSPRVVVRIPLDRYGAIERQWTVYRIPLTDFTDLVPDLPLSQLQSVVFFSARPGPVTLDVDAIRFEADAGPTGLRTVTPGAAPPVRPAEPVKPEPAKPVVPPVEPPKPVTPPAEPAKPVVPPAEPPKPVTPPAEPTTPVVPPAVPDDAVVVRPSATDSPNLSTEPDRPVTPPAEPAGPVVLPNEPAKPVVPPSEPVRPVIPPDEPTRPVAPPAEPAEPVTPPAEPVRPVTPPAEPTKPVTPPVEPARPVEPAPPAVAGPSPDSPVTGSATPTAPVPDDLPPMLPVAFFFTDAAEGDTAWEASSLEATWSTNQGERGLDDVELQEHFVLGGGGWLPVIKDTDPLHDSTVIQLQVKQPGFAWWVAKIGQPGWTPVDLSGYLRNGRFELAVRGAEGEETIRIGVFDRQDPSQVALVPLNQLCTVTTAWQVVRIPLRALKAANPELDWSRVGGVQLASAHGRPFTIWLDDLRVVNPAGGE